MLDETHKAMIIRAIRTMNAKRNELAAATAVVLKMLPVGVIALHKLHGEEPTPAEGYWRYEVRERYGLKELVFGVATTDKCDALIFEAPAPSDEKGDL